MGPEMSEWLDKKGKLGFKKKVPLVVAICLECVGTLENEDPVVLDKGSQNEYIQC